MDIETLQTEYESLPVDLSYKDEQIGRRCCALALEALRCRSYGVGAVLLDGNGDILAEGFNRVFEERYHPAAHAEMELLNAFERDYPDYGDRSELKLVVSLEPCPMCFSRILLSGIGHVRFLCPDPDGGMTHLTRHLPAAWRNLASLADVGSADVSRELRAFVRKVAEFDQEKHRKRIIAQIRG